MEDRRRAVSILPDKHSAYRQTCSRAEEHASRTASMQASTAQKPAAHHFLAPIDSREGSSANLLAYAVGAYSVRHTGSRIDAPGRGGAVLRRAIFVATVLVLKLERCRLLLRWLLEVGCRWHSGGCFADCSPDGTMGCGGLTRPRRPSSRATCMLSCGS